MDENVTFVDGITPAQQWLPISVVRLDGSVHLTWFCLNDQRVTKKEGTDEEIEQVLVDSTPCGACGHWHERHKKGGCISDKRGGDSGIVPCGCAEYVPQVASWRRLTPEEALVFGQRQFRNALRDDGKAFGHDIEKARELHRRRLAAEAERKEREAEKQRLRDITDDPRIDAATTIDELKAITLDAKEPG